MKYIIGWEPETNYFRLDGIQNGRKVTICFVRTSYETEDVSDVKRRVEQSCFDQGWTLLPKHLKTLL